MDTTKYNLRNFLFACLSTVMFVSSCNSDKKTNSTTDSSAMVATDTMSTLPADTALGNCYAYIKNRDTASLKLQVAGEEVTGDLSYKLFEKDSNKGKLAGELKGDTIIAEYTFDSEGMRSVREIVFLHKDGKLIEGFGDVEQKGLKTVFKNRAALRFDTGLVFDKADCR
ncbi:MAG: hypothetical protein V4687_19030 [Bacteroidota bacterium]